MANRSTHELVTSPLLVLAFHVLPGTIVLFGRDGLFSLGMIPFLYHVLSNWCLGKTFKVRISELKIHFFLVQIALRCVYDRGGKGERENAYMCDMWVCGWRGLSRGQRRVSGVLLSFSTLFLWGGVSPRTQSSQFLAKLTSGKPQWSSYLYPTQIWGCRDLCDHAQRVTWT